MACIQLTLVLLLVLSLRATAFQHTECFNAHGEPSGASIGNLRHTAALVQGFEFLESFAATQLIVPR